jgi:hypothetical protein
LSFADVLDVVGRVDERGVVQRLLLGHGAGALEVDLVPDVALHQRKAARLTFAQEACTKYYN